MLYLFINNKVATCRSHFVLSQTYATGNCHPPTTKAFENSNKGLELARRPGILTGNIYCTVANHGK